MNGIALDDIASAELPFTAPTLDAMADSVAAGTDVAGLGESTRFAHETSDIRDQIFRRLVRSHGFRVLAIQDDALAGQVLDAYVNGGTGSASSALKATWRPWQTTETAIALKWIRAFNDEHPDDPVRIIGVKPPQVKPADYDAVIEHVRRTAPDLLPELMSHLEPIRTAHEIDEHVQRARGIHPGRGFAEQAHDALAIVEQLTAEPENVVELMRRIVRFHERSVAGSGDYAGDARTWAETIIAHQRRTGRRIAYWDGIAHTAAAPTTLGIAPDRGSQPTVGSILRQHYGSAYVSVAIGFHHGDLGVAVVPEPAQDWLDARLAAPERPNSWLDLRSERERSRWDGPWDAGDAPWNGPGTMRVISGVYTTARDAAEHLAVDSLSAAFDVLVHVHQVSPVHQLSD
jgi:erythromycin esterase